MTASRSPHLVVGGGPAAASAAAMLAQAGSDVVVLTAEDRAPYDRTVLSKSALTERPPSIPALWPDDGGWPGTLELRTGTRVTGIDPDGHQVITAHGEQIPFHRLLLATGAVPRRLDLPGFDDSGVHYLRDARDAFALVEDLDDAQRLVVIGGGVIGLEVAASARTRGLDVEVVEAAPRVLGRGVPEPVAQWLVRLHTERGVRIRTGVAPSEVVRRDGPSAGRVQEVRLADGTVLPADLVVVGIGITPRDALARAAGLTVDDGIVVDRAGRTSHPDVFAAGDAVRMLGTGSAVDDGRGIRLESYQAAGQQGEVAARAMLGEDAEFTAVPWSWSDQYDAVLQSSGLAPDGAEQAVLGGGGVILVLSLVDGRLVAVCGVAHGPAAARPVRAAQPAIAAGAIVNLEALRAAGDDVSAVTTLLRAAGR